MRRFFSRGRLCNRYKMRQRRQVEERSCGCQVPRTAPYEDEDPYLLTLGTVGATPSSTYHSELIF